LRQTLLTFFAGACVSLTLVGVSFLKANAEQHFAEIGSF